jgi:zinc transporter ZupT
MLLLAFGAVILHALADGMALSSGAHGHAHEAVSGLALAVVIHRVPEGAALWYVLSPAGRRAAMAGIGLDAVFSVAGFALGDAALPVLGSTGVALAQAFLAGVLLHVLLHRPAADSAVALARP